MNLTSPSFIALAAAGFSLIVGLVIFWRINPRSEKFYTTARICLALIILFLVLVIFSFFPSTVQVSGSVYGLTLTAAGAFAAFFILWWVIDRKTLDVINFDRLRAEKLHLEEDLGKKNLEIANLRNRPEPLPAGRKYIYRLNDKKSKSIILITGGIQDVRNIDVWVNSENTNMFMSRYTERTISGMIRYLGAKKDGGSITEDVIANELAKAMGGKTSVDPTTVLVTPAGELEKTHGVKLIFHVASVQGTPGYGYQQIPGIERCVTTALTMASSAELAALELKSIVFPLLGTGTAGGDTKTTARRLFQTAVSYLKDHDTPIESVNFMVLYESQLNDCLEIMPELPVGPPLRA